MLLSIYENFSLEKAIGMSRKKEESRELSFEEYTGSRIRLYRRQKHMTLDQLAQWIHKSTATVSKYERGEVSPDLETLCLIADLLSVSPLQLLNYSPESHIHEARKENNFFEINDKIYVYQYFTPERKIYRCVLEIARRTVPPDDVIMYYGVDDLKNFRKSQYLYNGKIHILDTVANIILYSPFAYGDCFLICAKVPFSKRNYTFGLMNGMSESMRNPCAYKVLLSDHPMPESMDDKMIQDLLINTKDTFQDLKRTNTLVVY